MKDRKNYRASFVLDMRSCPDSVDAISDKLREVIADLGGDVTEFKNLGQKTFERAIDKKYPCGEYLQFTFRAGPDVPAGIKEKLRLDKTVNRVFIESCRV
jgi:small subunit ribosomal protein S6